MLELALYILIFIALSGLMAMVDAAVLSIAGLSSTTARPPT